jgi:hypothetical protein
MLESLWRSEYHCSECASSKVAMYLTIVPSLAPTEGKSLPTVGP